VAKVKHGKCGTPLYMVWKNMKKRCYNSNNKRFKDYGGRDIVVCEEWRDDAGAFITWAENNGWKPGLEIDRIDNNKGYSPENCRFVTPRENNLNQRLLIASNKSGYRGVSFHKASGKWAAYVTANDKQFWLGVYVTPEKAAIARDHFILENNLQSEYKLQILTKKQSA
jgi:hypothetical protein